jgi:membrane protein implicated in regulation of membrane protease activity
MAVDVAVAFLGVAFLFFVVDLPFWLTVVVSLIAGVVAAPFTRRAEERALARRPHPG